MNICRTGPNDRQPPEPVEEPEFKIKINAGPAIELEQDFTADELNLMIEAIVYAHEKAEVDHPIYLNGTEWNGNQLDNEDMANL